MISEKRYYAICASTNEVEFNFPYQSVSTLILTLRNQNKKNELMITISKGQIMTSVFDDKSCRVKFDDNKPMNFTYSSISGGS